MATEFEKRKTMIEALFWFVKNPRKYEICVSESWAHLNAGGKLNPRFCEEMILKLDLLETGRKHLAGSDWEKVDHEPRLVYRVQNSKGLGPYMAGELWKPKWREVFKDCLDWTLKDRSDQSRLFLFDTFLLTFAAEHSFFACRSYDELMLWFPRGVHQTLMESGYGIVEIKADRVIWSGPTQVLCGRFTAPNINITVLPW